MNFLERTKGSVVVALTSLFVALICGPMAAQTYKVIYNFTGYRDGALPYGRLAMDSAGRLYGTTLDGGIAFSGAGYGSVYKLTNYNSSWAATPLYAFAGGSDGAHPYAGVTIGPDGAIYGTTYAGGTGSCSDTGYSGCGTVFVLRPSATVAATLVPSLKETVLYRFTGGTDGASPETELFFQDVNTMYGTTPWGGNPGCFGLGCGVVYQLMRTNGVWTENTIYRFSNDSGGCCPYGGVITDKNGKLYGTTLSDGIYAGGTAFQLIPPGSGWTENVLYQFDTNASGWGPSGPLLFDSAGNLYGTNQTGQGTEGNVFELTPGVGSWNETALYNFTGGNDGGSPVTGVVADANGNLYGTALLGGDDGYGVVFELSPVQGGGYSFRVLHSFDGVEGSYPGGGVILAPNGKLYGTAQTGGQNNYGVVYEITP